MGRLWTAAEIGKMIGISGDTVKLWERENLVPAAMRIGRTRKRVWGKAKVLMILEYARDLADYPIGDWIFDRVRSA